jgi:hypothetical protein
MSWQTARRVILMLYGTGFLLLALLLAYGALFGERPHRLWLYLFAALLAAAEGVGLLLFLGVARIALKIALALGAWYAAKAVIDYAAWQAMVLPIGFAGLLLLEFGFIPVDRKIADARRAAAAGGGSPR